jgi:hypothetical protein
MVYHTIDKYHSIYFMLCPSAQAMSPRVLSVLHSVMSPFTTLHKHREIVQLAEDEGTSLDTQDVYETVLWLHLSCHIMNDHCETNTTDTYYRVVMTHQTVFVNHDSMIVKGFPCHHLPIGEAGMHSRGEHGVGWLKYRRLRCRYHSAVSQCGIFL